MFLLAVLKNLNMKTKNKISKNYQKLEIFVLAIFSLSFVFFAYSKVLADDCPVSEGGNYTLSSSCTIPSGGSMNIVDGDLTVDSGVTLTISDNARLTITPGHSIYVKGTISLSTSGAKIVKKKNDIILNSASGSDCSDKCPSGYSCVSIGQDSYGTDNYYWVSTDCSGGSCEYKNGDCSTVMTDQCGPGTDGGYDDNYCCDIEVYWTRCLCIEN